MIFISQDLQDRTAQNHYENYRAKKLSSLMGNQKEGKPQTSPLHALETEKREHRNKMKKMEQEMEQVFESKVKEKINRLNDSELGRF